MSFEKYMNFDQYLNPKYGKSKNGKNGNGRNGRNRHANHQSGEFDFGDLGLDFNGSFKNLSGNYLEKVNAKRGSSYDYMDSGFDVGGSQGFDVGGQQSAISPLFQQGFGYSGKRTRLEKIADRETREEDRARKKRLKREAKESKSRKSNGSSEYTEHGTQKLAGIKGDTIGGKIIGKLTKKHSKYSKEDLKSEDEADKQTRARLRELIEEEKQRKAEERK